MTKTQSSRNIKLAYAIIASKYMWLWLGTWIFYYSSFGGYKAVGLLEAVMAASNILFEIPTGAVGDLLGKKRTIMLGLAIEGIASIWMGFAPNLTHMVLSLIMLNLGGALFSGTYEAMIYDTLKETGEEKKYKKVLGNTSVITLVVFSICGVTSGYIYEISAGLPYILTGISLIIGATLTLGLTEPKVNTERFTIKSFFIQNLEGFRELFLRKEVRNRAIGFLLTTFITLIIYEGYNDILAVEFGYDPMKLGYAAAIMSLGGAISTYFLIDWTNKFNNKVVFLIGSLLFAMTLILSPYIGLILGGVMMLARYILDPIINNEVSDILNSEIDSKNRATALSTFNMLKRIPYMVFIYTIGASSDVISPMTIAVILGIILVGITGTNVFLQKKQ